MITNILADIKPERIRKPISAMKLITRGLAPMVLGCALALGGTGATAAQSAYSVRHDFAHWSGNWANAYRPDIGLVNYHTYAQANQLVDFSPPPAAPLLQAGQTFTDTSRVFAGTASAVASVYAGFNSASLAVPVPTLRGWQVVGDYTWGTTISSGSAFAQDNTNSYAFASSHIALTVGEAVWGRNGRFLWVPKISSTVGGSASAFSRRLRDPIEIAWTDSSGQQRSEQLLNISVDRADNDSGVFDWDAETTKLRMSASEDASFEVSSISSWLMNQGTLKLSYSKASNQYSLDATGSFAGVQGQFNPVTAEYELSLGAIDLAYTAPVDTYRFGLGGSGEGLAMAVPEPSSYALFVGGLALMIQLRRAKRT